MPADGFEERIALLEEHIVTERKTSADYLAFAEASLAEGHEADARFWLHLARIHRRHEVTAPETGEGGEG